MKTTLDLEKALTTEEAAQILGCSPKLLVKMRGEREKGTEGPEAGPAYFKMGRLVRYRMREIMKYMDQNSV